MGEFKIKKAIGKTDITYGICTMGSKGDVGFGKEVVVSINGNEYSCKMHNSVKGRIGGFGKVYKENGIEEGDVLEISFDGRGNIYVVKENGEAEKNDCENDVWDLDFKLDDFINTLEDTQSSEELTSHESTGEKCGYKNSEEMKQEISNSLKDVYEDIYELGQGFYRVKSKCYGECLIFRIDGLEDAWQNHGKEYVCKCLQGDRFHSVFKPHTYTVVCDEPIWIGRDVNGNFYFLEMDEGCCPERLKLWKENEIRMFGVSSWGACEEMSTYIGEASLIPCTSGEIRIVVHSWDDAPAVTALLVLDENGQVVMEEKGRFAMRSRFHEYAWVWNEEDTDTGHRLIDLKRGTVLWPETEMDSFVDIKTGRVCRAEDAETFFVCLDERNAKYYVKVCFLGGTAKYARFDPIKGEIVGILDEIPGCAENFKYMFEEFGINYYGLQSECIRRLQKKQRKWKVGENIS